MQTGLSLAETDKAPVTVVAHTPEFDPDRNLWFCDIELTAGSSYQPFVRLALCRYQRNSIAGQHISRVVLADFAQLLPDRTATLRIIDDGRMAVTVNGPAGIGYLGGNTGSSLARGLSRCRKVTATVQQHPAGGDPDLGWTDLGRPVELQAMVGQDGLGDVTWAATVPSAPRPPGPSYRLLLREYEIHPTDGGDSVDPFNDAWERRTGPAEFPVSEQVRQRLVYADSFPL